MAALVLLVSNICTAAVGNGPAPFSTLFSGSLNYNYVSTTADEVAGATYTRQYAQPASLKIELGFPIGESIYLGFVLDSWMAGRTYNDGTSDIDDKLDYKVVGVELGYMGGNPRSFFAFTGFVGYPLNLQVISTTGTFTKTGKRNLCYGARGLLGLRMTSWLALLMEAGYRIRDLGDLTSGSTSYLGQSFSLTGLYISTGIGFTL